jgi:hypothetical protein
MTYVGTPPRVVAWRPQRRNSKSLAEQRARAGKIALAYAEREKLEVLFYGAEASWQHAFAALQTAADSGAVVATRQARYQLARADHELWAAYRRLLTAHRSLQSLLAEARRQS